MRLISCGSLLWLACRLSSLAVEILRCRNLRVFAELICIGTTWCWLFYLYWLGLRNFFVCCQVAWWVLWYIRVTCCLRCIVLESYVRLGLYIVGGNHLVSLISQIFMRVHIGGLRHHILILLLYLSVWGHHLCIRELVIGWIHRNRVVRWLYVFARPRRNRILGRLLRLLVIKLWCH